MSSLNALIMPALLGLLAGVSHGILTHHAGLPHSLAEQFLPPLQVDQFSL